MTDMKDEKPAGEFAEDEAWLRHRAAFSETYDEANYKSPLQRFVMHASHRLTERAIPASAHYPDVIEIGAGTGEHLPFVRHRYDRYVLTDLDSKTLDIARQKLPATLSAKAAFEAQPSGRLQYGDNSFDRLVATHVLEHIYQPHLALKEWQRVVRKDGTLSILIPTDPGMAWRLGRHLGPRRHALRQGLAYDYLMAREHVNSCNNLIALLRHYFPQRTEHWWPTPIPSIDLNLFFLFTAKNLKG
ncbi:MAG TPA: class I SAM-dependent methyltransferase [Moraxellaceae bacterium]